MITYSTINNTKTVTDTVKPKIDKYDFENYRSVAHFDKGWNPFGKEGIAEMFNGIADFLFTINRMLVDITDTAIDYLYNLNAIDKFRVTLLVALK